MAVDESVASHVGPRVCLLCDLRLLAAFALETRHLAALRFAQKSNLAECLRRKKEYAEAESVARKLTETEPKVHAPWETLGSIILDIGDASRHVDSLGTIYRELYDRLSAELK